MFMPNRQTHGPHSTGAAPSADALRGTEVPPEIPSTEVPYEIPSTEVVAASLAPPAAGQAPPTTAPEVLTALIDQVDAAWARDDAATAIRLLTVGLWPLFLDRPSELRRLLIPVPEDAAPPALLLAKRFALPVLDSPERIRLLSTRPLDAAPAASLDTHADQGWRIAQRMLAHRLRGEFDEARDVAQRLRQHIETEAAREPAQLPQFLAAAYSQMGTTELLAGDTAAALSHYRRALAAADGDEDLGIRRDALVKQACVLAMEGRLREAETMLTRADTHRLPNNAYAERIRARIRLARALVAVERMDERAPDLLASLDRDLLFEYWPLVLLAEGRWRLASGNPAGVLDLVDAATESRPLPEGSLGLCVATFLREQAGETLGMPPAQAVRDPDSLPWLCALGAVRALITRADPLVAVHAARFLAHRRGVGPSVRLEALLLTSLALQRAGLPADDRVGAAAAALARDEGLWRPLAVVPASVRDELPLTLPPHVGQAVVPTPPPAVVLTPREREVLAALTGTESLAQIARRLHVSVNTVKSQVRSLYRRMGVSSRHEAIAEATRLGLVSLPPAL
ncbi:LuxR C-terminal-related transcriptional regulator [Microbacterium sp. bgisy207]|uniref:helix-turn-helix transcriptional regulator n=1 Tax=Microbacterium sp. bgisy207 TaxID=3413800 RepID=UPI003EBDE8CD